MKGFATGLVSDRRNFPLIFSSMFLAILLIITSMVYGLGLFMYLLYLTPLVKEAEDPRWGK